MKNTLAPFLATILALFGCAPEEQGPESIWAEFQVAGGVDLQTCGWLLSPFAPEVDPSDYDHPYDYVFEEYGILLLEENQELRFALEVEGEGEMRERILTVLDLNGKPQSPAPCGGLVFPSGLQSSPMEFARTPNGDWEIRIFSQTSWAGEAWNVSTWERAADGVYLYAGTVVKD